MDYSMSKLNKITDLKRSRSVMIPPLQDINVRREFYLKEFIHKLETQKTKMKKFRIKKLWLRSIDLRFIFYDISFIVHRLNTDFESFNRREELFEIARSTGREWTPDEAEEYEKLSPIINYINLDVKTLFVNIVIFMDKLARFLSWSFKEQIGNKNFTVFRKAIANYGGKNAQKIFQILNKKSQWFKTIKDLRDDFIIHHPASRGVMEFLDGEAFIVLTTSKGGYDEKHIVFDAVAKRIAVTEINNILSQLKELVQEINKYFCSHLEKFPTITNTTKTSNKQLSF